MGSCIAPAWQNCAVAPKCGILNFVQIYISAAERDRMKMIRVIWWQAWTDAPTAHFVFVSIRFFSRFYLDCIVYIRNYSFSCFLILISLLFCFDLSFLLLASLHFFPPLSSLRCFVSISVSVSRSELSSLRITIGNVKSIGGTQFWLRAMCGCEICFIDSALFHYLKSFSVRIMNERAHTYSVHILQIW